MHFARVSGKRSGGLGGKVKVWVAEIHGSGETSAADKHTHTVKFSVNASERTEFSKPRSAKSKNIKAKS